MQVLITGDRGYIGSVLTSLMIEQGYDVVGYDSAYFADNLLLPLKHDYRKITKDIRDVRADDLNSIDSIIHLAGLSYLC